MNRKYNTETSKLIKICLIIIIIAVLLFLLIYGIYRYNFPGWFSDKQEDWGTFGDYIGGLLGPILSLISILLIIWTIFETNRNSRNEIAYNTLFEFLKEYRSDEMGKKLKILYNFYDKFKINECETEKYQKAYLKEYKKGSKIHHARRSLSHFYDQITIFYKHKIIKPEIIFEMWSEKVIEKAYNILIPCEEIILKYNNDKKTKVELLPFLYEEVKNYSKNKK